MAAVDVVQTPQLPAQPGPVEDVVAQHEGRRVPGEEVLAENEGLGQTLGPFLDDVGEGDPSSEPSPSSLMKAG